MDQDPQGEAISPARGEPAPRKLAPPRRILLICLAVVLVGGGLSGWITYLLPPYLSAGPMIQNTTTDAASVIWYTSKPTPGHLVLSIDGCQTVWPAANEGIRHRVRLTGLRPGTTYAYAVMHAGNDLSRGEFATNKPAYQPFSFVVFADSGKASTGQFTIASLIAERNPDFILHAGDLVYPGGDWDDYPRRFFAPYAELIRSRCFWPSLGNHDVSEPSLGGDLLGVFELPENGPPGLLPERNYWFDYGNARFAVIDSNTRDEQLAAVVAPWLKRVMTEPGPHWRFVALHHPPYTGSKHAPDIWVQQTLVPAFEEAGIDIVFAGHNHLYERTAPIRGGQIVEQPPAGRDAAGSQEGAAASVPEAASPARGVVYIVTGAGGAELYDADPPDQMSAFTRAYNDRVHSFTQIQIEGEALELRQIGVDGKVIDRVSMSKPGSPKP